MIKLLAPPSSCETSPKLSEGETYVQKSLPIASPRIRRTESRERGQARKKINAVSAVTPTTKATASTPPIEIIALA